MEKETKSPEINNENKLTKKENVKRIIYETLRKRDELDYNKYFSRMNSSIEDVPWFYIRIFVVGIIIFLFGRVMYGFSGFGNGIIADIIGGFFFSLTYFSFIYELMRKRELTLFSVLCIGGLAGLIAGILTVYESYFLDFDSNLACAFQAGIGEETIKGLCSILIITIINKKRKNKLTGNTFLLIGCAVGCAYGIMEDLDYIIRPMRYFTDASETIEIALVRGVNGIITHMGWTGLITYYFFEKKNPLKNWKFYVSVFGVMGYHTFWDIAYDGMPLYLDVLHTIALCILGAIELFIIFRIIKKENNFNGVTIDKKKVVLKLPYRRKMFVSTIIMIILVLLIGSQGLYYYDNNILMNRESVYTYYQSYEEFKMDTSNGLIANFDYDRPYNPMQIDEEAYFELGILQYATQKEVIDDVGYLYQYRLNSETNQLELYDIYIVIDGDCYREQYLSTPELRAITEIMYKDSSSLASLNEEEISHQLIQLSEPTYYNYYNVKDLDWDFLNTLVCIDRNVYIESYQESIATEGIVLFCIMAVVILVNCGIVTFFFIQDKKERKAKALAKEELEKNMKVIKG